MRAIDSNVVVRHLVRDHPEHAARANAVIASWQVFVSTTVLLETEWVLRSTYGFGAGATATALRALAGLEEVTVEDPLLLAEALDRVEEGMDFADALHLGAAARCDPMLTFDRDFIRAARGSRVAVHEP